MGRSVLVEPPKGSELAARFAAVNAAQPFADTLRELGASLSEEMLVATGELLALERDPRIWKHSADLIARRYLPSYVADKYGKEAAALLRGNKALAMGYARDLQRLEFLEATAAERAKEPAAKPHATTKALIFAEFSNVRDEFPDASLNYCFAITADRLGGPGAPINRAAVRRAVSSAVSAASGQPEQTRDSLLRANAFFQEFFRRGWRKRLNAL